MSERPAVPELISEKVSKTKHKVIARLGGAVFIDEFNLSSAPARATFTAALVERFPGIDADRVEADLVTLAATPAGPAPPDTACELHEVDVCRVVRPELFHTPDVSGITLAVVLDSGGRLVPRWRTYLRWADGRREVMDRPDRVTLQQGSTLYVHPDPGEPPGSEPPAWSSASRRDWLAGAAAPDPATVFGRVCGRIADFLDFPAEVAAGTAATIALWLMFGYAYPAWDAVPYLFVGGPTGSGKSLLLEVIQRLAFRALSTLSLTAPALFRTLHAYGGTLLYDEAERFRQATPDVQELQSMFLAGYKRGGSAIRLEPVGDGFRPVRFEVFGPKALACIAGLPPVLASRCIPISMFRAAGDSLKPKRRLDADPEGWRTVRDDLHVLALEHGPTWVDLVTRSDVVPAGIAGRNYELWQPLLALAGWLQGHGAEGLLGLVQKHAAAAVASARDDAVPEADELLLELLAEAVRAGKFPTTAELLNAAKGRDEVTFKLWGPKAVAARLKVYGVATPKKVNGERRYREVTTQVLSRIAERYGLDLGVATTRSTVTTHH